MLFVVAPHTQDFHRLFGYQYLIDEAMLDIEATRIGAGQITDEFFIRWWILIRVLVENFEQFLGFGS